MTLTSNVTRSRQKTIRKFTARRFIDAFGRYALALLATAIFLYPIIWLAVSSIKPNWEIYRAPLNLVPSVVQFDVYDELFRTAPFMRYMVNSMLYAFGGSLLAIGVLGAGIVWPVALSVQGQEHVFNPHPDYSAYPRFGEHHPDLSDDAVDGVIQHAVWHGAIVWRAAYPLEYLGAEKLL